MSWHSDGLGVASCGRCGGPHRQWNDSDDPTVVTCPLASLDKKDPDVLAAQQPNDTDRALGLDHSKAEEYIQEAERKGMMPKKRAAAGTSTEPAGRMTRRGEIPSRLSGSNTVQMNQSTKN